MAYSIVPPILVVLSLIGIILFLMKKSSLVSLLEERSREREGIRRGFGGGNKIFPSPEREVKKGIKHGFLAVLEKIIYAFKAVFLKINNILASWIESIRNKKEERARQKDKKSESIDVINRINQHPARQRGDRQHAEFRRNVPIDNGEVAYRPMISEKMTNPSNARKAEIKDRLEKILIDRIAANPKDTEAYERLGEYYFEIENYNYAKECFKQVIKLNPTNDDAKNRMKKLERILMR